MKRTDIEGLELFTLLTTIQSIVKNISSAVRRAGISKLFGTQGSINVQGEEQQNLDILANQVIRSFVRNWNFEFHQKSNQRQDRTLRYFYLFEIIRLELDKYS